MADPKPNKEPKTSKPPAETPNLWQRINAVRGEVSNVAKDKTIGSGSYAYQVATHEAIKLMLRPLMAKHGLVDFITEDEFEHIDTGVTRGSNAKRALISHQGRYTYWIVNIDNPEDRMTLMVRGYGEDAGDKGPGKASTYALKTAQKILFMVSANTADEEGVIPDEELTPKAELPIDPAQIDNILHLAKMLFKDDAEGRVQRMCHKLFSVDELKDLPAIHYDHAISALNKQYDREEKATDKSIPPVASESDE